MSKGGKFDSMGAGGTGVFARIEKKYPIPVDMIDVISQELRKYMHEDKYGLSTVSSLYYDTPSWQLIRTSIEKPLYKEKLRLRSYGVPDNGSEVFVEIKKKYSGIVYKRRISMPYKEAVAFLAKKTPAPDVQIGREIAYALDFYKNLRPAIMIIYERLAFFDNNDENLRLTFDTNMRYRMNDLNLSSGTQGKPILPYNRCIMEIKNTPFAIPPQLSRILDNYKIYPGSFSKVGTAYTLELKNHLGGYANVENAYSKRHS